MRTICQSWWVGCGGAFYSHQSQLAGQATTSYGYDAYQRLTATTYPSDNEVVTLAYNSMGPPKQLRSNQLGMIVDSAGYDEAGRLVQLRTALNNVWRTTVYAPFHQQNSNGGQLTNLWIGSTNNLGSTNAYNRQKFDYLYDNFGNIITRDESADQCQQLCLQLYLTP